MADNALVPHHSPFHLRVRLPLTEWFLKVFFFGLFGPLKVRDADRVPREGGVLILGNHLADVDPLALQCGCPRPIHFMAKSELFGIPLLGPLMRAFGTFPVRRGEADRTALRQAADFLKTGEAVTIFPEGRLSQTGEMQELKPGVGLIVRLAPGVPVVCVGLRNTNRILPYGKLLPRPSFRRVHVRWGEPRVFPEKATPEEIVAWATAELRALTAE